MLDFTVYEYDENVSRTVTVIFTIDLFSMLTARMSATPAGHTPSA